MERNKITISSILGITLFFMEVYGNCSVDRRFDSQSQYYGRRSKYLTTSIAELHITNDKTFENFEAQSASNQIRTNIICGSLNSQNTSNFNDLIQEQCREGFCSIIVENSTIDVLKPTLFPLQVRILQLFLNRTELHRIIPGTFDEITGLRELYLQNNFLTQVSEGVLNSLTNLSLLHLGRNKISVIHEYSLSTNLKFLYLNDNNISKLYNNVFKILPQLQFLDISNNPCETINLTLTAAQFDGIGINLIEVSPEITMNALSLKRNDHAKIEVKLKLLKRLNLSKNQLTYWNRIFNTSKIFDYLNLSSNIISEIDENGFAGLYNLTILDLSNNKLISLSHGIFGDLFSLQWLDLSQNKIISFQYGLFDSLKSLKLLNVSKNSISKEFNLYPFQKRELAFLYLDNNKIETLKVDNFSSYTSYFCSVKEVSLDNNSWSCEYLEQLVHSWYSVKIVDGSSQRVHNVRKIGCDDKFVEQVVSENDVELKNTNKQRNETDLIAIRQFERSLNFFNEGFRQSTFFKFFDSFNDTVLKEYLRSRENNREIIRNASLDEKSASQLLSSVTNEGYYTKNDANGTYKYLIVFALYAILVLLGVVVYFKIFRSRFVYNRTSTGDQYLEALL